MEGSLMRLPGPTGLPSLRRPKHVFGIRAASGQGQGDHGAPSAPPLPEELRGSERIKYPQVYSDGQDVAGAPGMREDQGAINESVFSTDQVQVWLVSPGLRRMPL